MHLVDFLICGVAAVMLVVGLALWASQRRRQLAWDADRAQQRRELDEERSGILRNSAAELQRLGEAQAIALAQAGEASARQLAAVQQDVQAEVRRRVQELEQVHGERLQAHEAAIAQARQEQERDRATVRAELLRCDQLTSRLTDREQAVQGRERTLQAREDSLDRKLEALDLRDTRMRGREQAVEGRLAEIDARDLLSTERLQAAQARLETVAQLTAEAGRSELLAQLDAQLTTQKEERYARHEKDLGLRAKELAVEVVSRAIQRYAAEHTAESTTAKIQLQDEEFKGRIIGKEGRNIKAFEQATGVDIIIEEGQPVITISCFDPVRRELARRTLEVLLEDGRIHPARIEEVLARVQQDLDRELVRLGEEAAFVVEVSGLHPQLIKLLGKLHFRTSYGQNVLKHTQEVAFLCGAMASDLGLDPKLGRRCGLLHDIGKAIDHEQEGSHPQLGYEALKRYGESEVVANAALAHHEGHQPISAYTVLAAAADAISAARPGARSESSERYLKRLQQLEDIACSFSGVQKAYAIQAGRELRVIINGHTLADQELPRVAREIARRIEDEVRFPGEVKVTCIRETRQTAVAR